ncbi:MAG: methyltransferase domain-containing protein [Candidatus Aminicenantaceae bacterium]
MRKDIFFEIHQGLPREGPGRNEYTKKAYEMLPKMDQPKILDIGCGPGGPTIELARISGGDVFGMDTHQSYLDVLEEKIKKAGLSERVKAVIGSMFTMDFPEESFDIIWAEGSIYIIGFEEGLNDWRRFIKPQGFLVVHEMTWLKPNPPKEIFDYWMKMYPGITTIPENLELIHPCGYKVLGHFPLPENAWWEEYYHPLEERINQLRAKYKENPETLRTLNSEQEEIDLYRKYSAWYGSVFYVMQKL